MVFTITPDIIQSSIKRELTDRIVETRSPILEEARALAEDLREKINRGVVTDMIDFDLRIPASILEDSEDVVLAPQDGRGPLETQTSVTVDLQDKEVRMEDFVPLRKVVKEVAPRDTEVIAAGKTHNSVDTEVFGEKSARFVGVLPEDDEKFISDALRGRAGKYWTIDEMDNSFLFVDSDPRVVASVPYTFCLDRQEYNTGGESDFGRTSQWIDIGANRRDFFNARGDFSRDFWKAYIVGGIYDGSTQRSGQQIRNFIPTIATGTLYFDHVHDLSVPFTMEEIKGLQVPVGSLTGEAIPEYNFFIEDYENLITSRSDVLNNTIPNIYIFSSELKNDEPNPEFKNFITLDGTLVTDEKVANRKVGRQKFDIKTHPIGQYYDLWARQYQNAIDSGATERLSKKFTNIAVPIEEIDIFNSYNEKSEMFPMLVDIRLSTDRTTTFAQILEDSGLTNAFMGRVINRFITGSFSSLDTQITTESITQRKGEDNLGKVSEFQEMKKRAWNLADLLNGLRQGEEKLDPEFAIFLGNYDAEVSAASGPEFQFFKSLTFNIMKSKLQTLIKQKHRTYKDLLEGKKAYSETVMYRISKHEFNNTSEPIQNFWLPNSNSIDVLRFIDTQVKYNKKYVYKVWAYQLVIGNRYWYTDLDVDSFDHHASCKVNMEPSVILVETPYFEEELRVADRPPIPPDIEINPYKGIDNQLLFFMRSNVGEFDAAPVLLQPEDQDVVNKIRDSQKRDVEEPISFASDDHPTIYQIFRIQSRPTSFDDFVGNLRASVNTDVNLESLQSATSVAFVDDILPNTKYYYIIRTIDVHGQFSNPTPVFEVEMINENGLIFPVIRCVEFIEIPRASEKPAKRFIQLVPNVLQSMINEEKSDYENGETAEDVRRKIHLGLTSDAVWGKRFKMRLTSRSTGKKVEINFTFENKDSEKA